MASPVHNLNSPLIHLVHLVFITPLPLPKFGHLLDPPDNPFKQNRIEIKHKHNQLRTYTIKIKLLPLGFEIDGETYQLSILLI